MADHADGAETPHSPPPPRGRAMDLTVVIPTVGRPILLEALRRLTEGSVLPQRVVIADQGGELPFEEWAAELAPSGLVLDVHRNHATGRSVAVNAGIRQVSTRFVAITDDDCMAAPDWIETMAARLRAQPDAIVSGRVGSVGDGPNVDTAPSRRERRVTRPGITFDPLSGGNVGFSLDTFRRVGPFDEHPSVRAAEDGDWAYRALRRGVPIVYAPEVLVRHAPWRDEAERKARYRTYARSQAGFYGKHIGRGDGFMALRAAVNTARAARRWARGVIRRDRELRMHGAAYVVHFLPGLLAGLRHRRDDA
ncbi:MAG TPA: glycosyltransferase family 2 protein [Longimicrobiales bacterium]|nr:glycosyltransferase family 2 protein [Longimicrobiales bacterium]